MMDGEILIKLVKTNNKLHPLQLQSIESDRFAINPTTITSPDNIFVDGIELGKRGEANGSKRGEEKT